MTTPDVKDIKPYVTIGPTKDLSVTVHKETFDSAFIWATLIFGVLLLIIIGLTVFFAYEASKLGPIPPPLEPITSTLSVHDNVGAAISSYSIIKGVNNAINLNLHTCTKDNNAKIVDDVCVCESPFFGPSCSIQKHDRRYFAVGDVDNIEINVITELQTNNKSFSKDAGDISDDSCSNYCNNLENCTGFIYRNNDCTLLTGNTIILTPLTYNNHDSELYLLSPDTLYFKDIIFLAESINSLSSRYWLVKETSSYLQLPVREIRKLSFLPKYSRIYGNYTGIFCTYKFTIDKVATILDRGDTTESIIHRPNTDINLPFHWKLKKDLYVVYV